jgi:DNA-binding GntR family transcriptional regulator
MSKVAMPKIAVSPPKQTVRRDRNIDEVVPQIADTLEEQIVLGLLNPRERLVEDDLCERYTLKRHVARQVLIELELRGLIERRKNVGALVKSYTPREVTELYAVRELLEAHAVRCIAFPIEEPQLDNLRAIQQEHDAAAALGDLRRVFRANIAFHRAFFSLAQNLVLTEAIREYERRTHAIRSASVVFPQYVARAQAEHHQMIEALQRGDRDALVELSKAHLVPSRDAYLEAHHRRQFSSAP